MHPADFLVHNIIAHLFNTFCVILFASKQRLVAEKQRILVGSNVNSIGGGSGATNASGVGAPSSSTVGGLTDPLTLVLRDLAASAAAAASSGDGGAAAGSAAAAHSDEFGDEDDEAADNRLLNIPSFDDLNQPLVPLKKLRRKQLGKRGRRELNCMTTTTFDFDVALRLAKDPKPPEPLRKLPQI